MTKEEFKELWENDDIERMLTEADSSWRHGCYMWEVYRFKDEYWGVNFRKSGDGEYHGIREDEFELMKVEPFSKTVVEYRVKVAQ